MGDSGHLQCDIVPLPIRYISHWSHSDCAFRATTFWQWRVTFTSIESENGKGTASPLHTRGRRFAIRLLIHNVSMGSVHVTCAVSDDRKRLTTKDQRQLLRLESRHVLPQRSISAQPKKRTLGFLSGLKSSCDASCSLFTAQRLAHLNRRALIFSAYEALCASSMYAV